jgi:hypothetical protein
MDMARFDQLTRNISTKLSRRAFASALGLGAVALSKRVDAKKKAGGKKKKKQKKTCTPQCAGKACSASDGCGGICDTCASIGRVCLGGACQCPGGTRQCQGGCIANDACCVTADCEADEICARNECVIGQGICVDDSNACVTGLPTCSAANDCFCRLSKEGETRCGGTQVGNCGACQTSADCTTLHPDIPGIFCVEGVTVPGQPVFEQLCCTTGQNLCVRPCPNPS